MRVEFSDVLDELYLLGEERIVIVVFGNAAYDIIERTAERVGDSDDIGNLSLLIFFILAISSIILSAPCNSYYGNIISRFFSFVKGFLKIFFRK